MTDDALGTCAQVIATLYIAVAFEERGVHALAQLRRRQSYWAMATYVLLWIPGVTLAFNVLMLILVARPPTAMSALAILNIFSVAIMVVFLTLSVLFSGGRSDRLNPG